MKKTLLKAKQKAQEKVSSRKKSFFFISIFIVFVALVVTRQDNEVEVLEGMTAENMEKIELEKQLYSMVKGYPIQQMVPYILEQDNRVAAFIVSIAKKESNWGKRTPKLDGQECYNYWGYRGGGERVTDSGYTCFDSPQEAIQVVGGRIDKLVYEYGRDTPQKMIVWKCGSSCAGHSSFGVKKWISDVSIYFQKIVH